MADEVLPRTLPPPPSVLYSDNDDDVGELLLLGEFGVDLARDRRELRRMALRWRGMLHELRARDRALVEGHLAAGVELLTRMHELVDEVGCLLHDACEARREERGELDDG